MNQAAIEQAIRDFPFSNYGLGDVDPNHRDAEWVPALAKKIVAALAGDAPKVIGDDS